MLFLGSSVVYSLVFVSLSAGSKRIKVITVATLSLFICLILVLAAYGCWRYRMKQNDSSLVSKENVEGSWKSDLQSQHVSGLNFFEIQTATDNFNVSNKLGQCGFDRYGVQGEASGWEGDSCEASF
ncbi:G-type lectin S-receptor-like serine/threonine-protein kinase [Raphanus sativus]|nr:G-type lectin S-receptor-like serine/threonine-protein kinase [Raphanus sativus]